MYDASPAKRHIGTTLVDILLVQLAGGMRKGSTNMSASLVVVPLSAKRDNREW